MKLILSILFLAGYTASVQAGGSTIWVDCSNNATGTDGSKQNPYKTISRAMRAAKPGVTIIIRKGIYRENVNMNGGEKGKPVSLESMPGERVVISGLRKVYGWKPVRKDVYKASIDWNPNKVFVGFSEQPMARLPKEGWWSVDQKDKEIFQTDKLKTVPDKLDGVKSYIWTQSGNIFFTLNIQSINRKVGSATFEVPNKWFKLTRGDKVYLKNHPALISMPGEWAVLDSDGKFDLYFMPVNKADLNKVEASQSSRNIISIYAKTDVEIKGLEIFGGMANGISAMKSERINIEKCLVHDVKGGGIYIRNTKDSIVQHNLVMKNYTGISVMDSSNVKVEENEVGFNYMDGILVSWKSNDIDVSRNYMHDHMLWGHPDNMQMYRDVKNIRITDNLFLTGGQALMVEHADNILFSGNMVVGSIANQVIWGHGNTTNVKVLNNTFAFAGYSPLVFTAHGYEVYNNVLMLGHSGIFFTYKPDMKLLGGNNLFWAAQECDAGIGFDRHYKTYKAFTDATPDAEKKSVYADPDFINSPVFMQVLKSSEVPDCTRDKLFLRYGTSDFKAGDIIEINFDGIKRKVISLTAEYLIISPSLEKLPIKPWLVANWKNNENLSLDLRLKPVSPGAGMFNGGPVGSLIDIQAYKRGDLNGNGKRDIPELPEDLKMPRY